MENNRHQILKQPAITAKKIVFGHPHGPYPRLYSELVGYGTDGFLHDWKRILECADDELLEDLLASLKRGSEIHNVLLVRAVCGGYDGMGKTIGKNGKLKRSARRFAYHALATLDLACDLEGVGGRRRMSDWEIRRYRWLLQSVQAGFSWLTPPSKTHDTGPLTEDESRLARAFVVTQGTQRDNLMEPGIYFLAEHYDEMKPFFRLIYSSAGRNTLSGLQALLATKPEAALASGAL